ncbi:beta-galactosidase-like [Lycium barbarum]|uniref:beta-galactosidase-like n=1 Tax=Lycium barbarum TaxID=112863 RepID=UPI00293EFCD5|nr:beta-galactosidase-like [Lycium barbarum]
MVILFSSCLFSSATEVTYDDRALKINGERKIILSGSIHYPRSTAEMWPSLIKKAKEGGLNAVETYVFWNAHEPVYRQYDFSGNLDLVKFIKYIQSEGLYAILRIGPYVCAEWNYGGFPVWLNNIQNMTVRTNNAPFMHEMKTFVSKIVDMMKEEKLFASQGGPIILSQIENEYGNWQVESEYGNDGKIYIQECAKFAESLNIGVPWIMCQQEDAPDPIINTANGYYADNFYPTRKIPKMWTENWTGWFKDWTKGKDPHRTAEDVAFAVARFYQKGGTLQNYYMYHGGTNFGRVAGGPYITTTYDYDAPLNEYGQLNQPKYGHLKELHDILFSIEKLLTYGNASTKSYGNDDWQYTSTVYEYNGSRACFLANANDKNDYTMNFEGKNYTVPAWSVSILPDCSSVNYNTAKVNAPKANMMRKNTAENSNGLNWSWRPEKSLHFKLPYFNNSKKGVFYFNQLLDQKIMGNDTSDYLWYMTSVDIKESDPLYGGEAILEVNTDAHVLYAFFNGKHIGTKWSKGGSFSFDFEQLVKIKPGKNTLSLLSVTVGLPNYGAYIDKVKNGILGPVKLKSPNGNVKDLSNNQWEYKIGLGGFERKLWEDEDRKWKPAQTLQTNRMFVWYKTTFKTPSGDDPVVLDMMGLGKGTAWVNGNNIGRYWLDSYDFEKETGCGGTCDYRGNYHPDKCATNCGQPTQRWYHVPRSFLSKSDNNLVIFEEFGGHPKGVKVQTVSQE